MDTSNPAFFVNAQTLPKYIGKRVRAVIKVSDSNTGGSIVGTSTDGQHLVVKGQPPASYSPYVEVIGTAEDAHSICLEIWTNFGANFDIGSYNTICQLADGAYKKMFV